MKYLTGLVILFLIIVFFTVRDSQNKKLPSREVQQRASTKIPQTSVIAENLDTPWEIVFLPDPPARRAGKSMLVTERPGRIRYIDTDGKLDPKPMATLQRVNEIGEGGLLGITLHPDFSKNNFIYLYYTYSGDEEKTFNRVVRMVYKNKKLSDETIILDKIPGAPNHNGGRIKFGPDNYLYVTTGDAQNPSQAQDTNSLAGKILRVTDNGEIPSDNPFHNPIYSYGHRNPQGLAWDDQGRLWATEHGRSGVLSGLDELNLIEKGKNYGWPVIQGDETREGMERPRLHSGATITWAPSGLAFFDGSFYFAGLRGKTLYEVVKKGDSLVLKEHFKNEFGRLREVVVGPDELLYITTSNQDGRGDPKKEDDKIIKVNPALIKYGVNPKKL